MVTHVVIFTWIPDAPVERIVAMKAALDQLSSELPTLVSLRHGSDVRWRDGNGDYAIVAKFADHAAWKAYQADPRHKKFVEDFVLPVQAARLTIQFENAE